MRGERTDPQGDEYYTGSPKPHQDMAYHGCCSGLEPSL
jgi:hypothetical protein